VFTADKELVDALLKVLPLISDNATHVCAVIPFSCNDYIAKWINQVREIVAGQDVAELTEAQTFTTLSASSKMFQFSTALGGLIRHSVTRSGLPLNVVVDFVAALYGTSRYRSEWAFP
jgi:hypothetical protein